MNDRKGLNDVRVSRVTFDWECKAEFGNELVSDEDSEAVRIGQKGLATNGIEP